MHTFLGSDTRKQAGIPFFVFFFNEHWLHKLEQIILPGAPIQLTQSRHICGEENPSAKVAPASK